MNQSNRLLQVPLINRKPHSQTRPPCRVHDSLISVAGRLCLKQGLRILAIIFLWAGCGYADGEELSDDQARQECFKGQAIYCLALGFKEEKAGLEERALELYRFACKKHPTTGHLRACTPMLNLAWKMNRLEQEVAPLEERCSQGNTTTCFYLGKEYLKLADLDSAARHLEPLCRQAFIPPGSNDYGPCYHLAKGYEQAGYWQRAREIFQFDCEIHSPRGQPSCAALKELIEMVQVHQDLAQRGIRGFDPAEAALMFVVFMSVLNVWIWFKGGRWALKYLSRGAPLLVGGGAVVWVFWPGKPEYPDSQWAVIFFACLLVAGVAFLAYRALHSHRISR